MTFSVIEDAEEYRALCEGLRRSGSRIALVPTMGALHSGHLSLIDLARQHSDHVLVSIFVNPTQFGPNEDYAKYPRTLARDLELCHERGARAVFAPEVASLYPTGETTRVRVAQLSEPLCGRSRPGHFEGVATIVTKLLVLTGAGVAVFGRKDYQQLKVIERLTRDLLLPIEIIGHPIVRDPDGLAMSSRNAYLSPDDRRRALSLPWGVGRAQQAFVQGERRVSTLIELAEAPLREAGLRIDYVSLLDPGDLSPPPAELSGPALLALAAYVGETRLIDNTVLGIDPPLGIPLVSASGPS